ncbi:hypothetical protein ACS0TY_028647 [Phlomoides rotata]
MFFNDSIQRRLETLLRPWLRGDSQLQLKLGFLRSNATLNNVSFNTSALNELLDDPSIFCFKEATVEHLSLKFSPFSSAAFTLVVRGLRIRLSLGEEEDEGGVKWQRKPRDTTVEDRNKALEDIDPEGCAVHGAIKKIADISTRTWRTSLLNTVTRHCHLELHDVSVLLQSPRLHDMSSCSLYMKNFRVESQILGHRCFIRGFMSSFSLPSEESSFNVDIESFEVTLNSDNHTNTIFPATDMSAVVNLHNFQSTSFSFNAPALNFLFTPADLSVIFLLYGLLSKEYKCTRSGRQLWNIVATRIGSQLPTSNMPLIRVVRNVSLWLRYITTYQSILLRVGYPTDEVMKRSATLMFHDTRLSKSMRSQWKLIAEIENDLPLEAIAAARRIIRHRVVSRGPGEKCNFEKLQAARPFSKLLQSLLLILRMMSCLLVSFMRILLLDKVVAIFCESSLPSGSVGEHSILQQSITLKFQEISLSVSLDKVKQPSINRKAVSDMGISYQDLLSFRFSLDAFFLRYLVNISEQHFTFAIGRLKVLSFSTGKDAASSHPSEYQKKEIDRRQIIVLADPAPIIYFPEAASDNATDDIARTSAPQLDCLLGQLWLNWKSSSLKSEGENMPNVHAPWIVGEMSNCLMDHGMNDSRSQVNCSLVIGKLNFNLEYYSFASAVVLFRHLQCALQWSLSRRGDVVLHALATAIQDPPVRYWSSKITSYSSKIRGDIIRIISAKHFQIGALIAGPHFQISLSDDHFHAQTTNACPLVTQVSLEIYNIELFVSPNLEDNIGLSSGITSESDIGPESLGLKEPKEISIPDSDNGAYSCQGQVSLYAYLKVNGLMAYCDEKTKNKQHQIIVLRPTIAHLNYVRKDHHSLGSTAIAVSATSHWMATGFSCLMFLDELYVFAKIVFGVLHESLAFTANGSCPDLHCGEARSRETAYVESECEQTFSVRSNQRPLVTKSQVLVNSSFDLKSLDIVLHNSRKSCSLETYMNTMPLDGETGKKSALNDILWNGIYVSIQHSMLEFNITGQDMDVVIDTTGSRCIIFRYLSDSYETSDKSELKYLLCSLDFLTEASVHHSKFCFHLRNLKKALPSASSHSTFSESSSDDAEFHVWDDSPLIMSTDSPSDHWLFTNIATSGIYMAGCPVQDVLVNDLDEFNASLSVGGEFQAVSCECKGGAMLLEATTLTMYIECFTSYHQRISELLPSAPSCSGVVVAQDISEMAHLDGCPSLNLQQVQCQEAMWGRLESLSMSLLHLSLILVKREESGKLQELLLEVDFHLSLEVLNTVRKLSIAGSKFSLLSQFRHGHLGHKSKVIRSSISAIKTDESISRLISKDSSTSLQHKDYSYRDLADASSLSTSVPEIGSHVDIMNNPGKKNLHTSPQKYILKDLQCFLEAERPVTSDGTNPAGSNDNWVGNGSISGFDMTISLYEINMLLSASESCSKVLGREGTSNADSRQRSYNQEPEDEIEEMVPDGTVVALQDVDQHMYISVRAAESGYDIAGTVHYSLVGDRALFRVNYHKPRRWGPQTLYISLVSLYAKDNSGEPLRLSCHPRSRFVDLCPNDSGSALWRMLPFKPDAYEDAVELESSTSFSKRTFHLVNKKNDYALAFSDDTLEFVSKPGNLFKLKVFDDPGPVCNNLLPDRFIAGELSSTSVSSKLQGSTKAGTHPQCDSNVNGMGELRTKSDLLGITVTMGEVTLTIVHELSDTEEKFPLLQGSILPNQTIIQISNDKVRIMNTFEVILYYFDSQQNSWKEFIQPLEIRTFYSQKFPVQGADNSLQGMPSHFYAKFNEVTVLLSELSLDVLLFVIGKLDLAGPFAVKSSLVLANCCKVENQSGLTLVCQFYDNQDASISSRQSTTIFLRHLSLVNQPPEASFFSVQLVQQGFLSTSPIHLSLLEARKFAWRTRIVSSQDSRSFPGPFIVVEISKRIEDGLSIVVTPLLMIHNETDFSLELCFKRPQNEETESASLILEAGDVVDDAMTAFNAIDLSGGPRKALTSLSVGNYVFSFRPNIAEGSGNFKKSSVEWSDDLKGGKPIRLSGLFDKLSYQVRKAFAVNSAKFSLSSANCALTSEEGFVSNVYFLIQTVGKAIPVVNPDNFGYAPSNRNSTVAMQEQKEIFILPTIQVSNLLHSEIHVSLTDKEPHSSIDNNNTWSQATIACGSAANFYANPDTIYFVVTLTSFGSSCKPVNSRDWVRKLEKRKGDISQMDIELDFGGGKYFAMLRLSRGARGTLEVGIFTSYALQNGTDTPLFCFSANQKPLSRGDRERFGTSIPPELGSILPPYSITSWFSKCNKVRFKLLEDKALEAQLDLNALSGLTEIDLEAEELFGSKTIMRLAVSLSPSLTKDNDIVSLSPRYVVNNESEDVIAIRQCYMEDMEESSVINSKERIALRLKTVIRNKKVTTVVENILKKHTKSQNDSQFFIQFRPNVTGLGWSGPVCVASLGRFFLKFPENQSGNTSSEGNLGKFAAVHVVEEGSTIVLHFHRPPVTNLPYRIENCLRDAPLTYYQKGSAEPETLGAGVTVNYVWDDLTLPHKLVIQIDDLHILREINLDKVRSWKPFSRSKHTRGLGFHLPLEKKPEDQKHSNHSRPIGSESARLGFEVYAEGTTRVLRICEFSDSHKVNVMFRSSRKMRLRISYFSVHLLEHVKQEVDLGEPSNYAPIIIGRLERINLDGMITDQQMYSQLRVQSLSVDEKWAGAPLATMLRRHQSENADANDYILHVAVVLLPTSYCVKQVKYLSIVLQPLDLNLDEETLMKIVPFFRRSLSNSSTPRQQYYFDHFEIHPIKIVASFLPGDSQYSYNSTQETLRSLLHSVIKIPAIKRTTVELNGVLVTHALITLVELTIKCAQHYSWYAMRGIYIAKGSLLLPPAFASIFDDLASSSLDVFFDPSSGLHNLPGVTMGTLKLISKFIDNKGFSGTKRYFGDLGKTLKTAGSNMLFAAVTEISDSILKGAETSGVNGMVIGFRHGILKLAMEPSVLGSAFMEGGADRKIKLDRSPGVDELYIEGYLQAMLDTMYKQEYLKVRVMENQVILKNLPPSSSLIDEIMERVKGFLASKALLKGDFSTVSSFQHIRGEREWRIGPTILTLCEHLFVSFMIRALRKQSGKVIGRIKWKEEEKAAEGEEHKVKFIWKWGIGKFVLSGIVAYIDGRLCRNIPNPIARRVVSGFLLSFLDQTDDDHHQTK